MKKKSYSLYRQYIIYTREYTCSKLYHRLNILILFNLWLYAVASRIFKPFLMNIRDDFILSLSLLLGTRKLRSYERFAKSRQSLSTIYLYIVYEDECCRTHPTHDDQFECMCRFRAWVRPDVRYWFRPSFPVAITIYVF